MQQYSYDFHVHSCLSPCGDDDMTPNNMVNMAALLGCEIMAITDHNSCKNAPAAMAAGEKAGVLVVPGMELCTAEEAHVICLFESLEGAMAFGDYVYEHMPPMKNRPEIFGNQLILDSEDRVIGREERLLISATDISADQVVALTAEFGGAAFPAHIDKDSYSIVASLGSLPEEAGFQTIEITAGCDRTAFLNRHPEIKSKQILTDSDAHYLENLQEEMNTILLPEKTRQAVVQAIRRGR